MNPNSYRRVLRNMAFRRIRNRILLTVVWLAVGGAIAVFTLNLLPSKARDFVAEGQTKVAKWKQEISGRTKDDLGRIALETLCSDASEWKIRKAPNGVGYWSCKQDDITEYFGVQSDILVGGHGSVECQSAGSITWRVQTESGNQVSESTDVVQCNPTPQGLLLNWFTCERAVGLTSTYVGAASITNFGRTLRDVAIKVTALSADGVELSSTTSSSRDVTNGTTLTLRASGTYGSFFESFLSNVKYCNVRVVQELEARSFAEALVGGRYESLSVKTSNNQELPVLFNPR